VALFFYILAILAWVTALIGCSAGTSDQDETDKTDLSRAYVITDKGALQGEVEDEVAVFRGIPYAAPPTGELRWKAPVAHSAWAEPRQATQFEPACPQPGNPFTPNSAPEEQAEDCLTLNIWTTAEKIGDRQPIMLWIHGGGLTTGTGSLATFNGSYIARAGSVVLVSINYRLGQLGGLAHPLLSAEAPYGSSGNYMLLDQIQALRWVKQNGAQFGGDPTNITIFGESAGGIAVCALLASPIATGLFQQAIIQSGGCTKRLRDLHDETEAGESAQAIGLTFAEELGCSEAADVLACMRNKSVDEVLAAHSPSSGLLNNKRLYGTTVDGYVLPDSLGQTIEDGKHNIVPVMAGSTGNEPALYRSSYAHINTVGAYVTAVNNMFGDFAPTVLATYPVSADQQALRTYERLLGDVGFVCPARKFIRDFSSYEPRSYLYQFTWVHPFGEASGWGAFHASELAYLFHTFENGVGYDAEDEQLADAMIGYWTRFATSGGPNATDGLAWPRYQTASDQHLQIDLPLATGTALKEADCDALAPLF